VSTRSAPPSALEQLVLDAVPRAQEHCGMALEPRTVAEEEKKPELEEMSSSVYVIGNALRLRRLAL
jgi:hypothetical protein